MYGLQGATGEVSAGLFVLALPEQQARKIKRVHLIFTPLDHAECRCVIFMPCSMLLSTTTLQLPVTVEACLCTGEEGPYVADSEMLP